MTSSPAPPPDNAFANPDTIVHRAAAPSAAEPRPAGLIIVSNRLPVSLERRDDQLFVQRSVGGLASALTALAAHTPTRWIGWPGLPATSTRARTNVRAALHAAGSFHPVFIPARQFDRYYAGFSNNCVWPLFHYFPRLARFDPAEWEAYTAVNERFHDAVLEAYQPGDQVWVHDYQLLLLPGLLRRSLPEAAIGFFLHIPFPSYELFRELPCREALLRGLLGADLIGFHTYDYMRHFLSSLQRGLGLEHEFGRVAAGPRVTHVDTFPLGVDAAALAQAARVAPAAPGLPTLDHERLILSVDRLDFTKGLPERLRAFAHFLEKYPEWRGRVRLVLIGVPSRATVAAYQRLKRRVNELVGYINGKYSTPDWSPIHYLYRSFSPDELAALYRAADVALVTPLRDGMNLVAKEYLACRLDDTGVLILSETAGAAAELGEALIVNPADEAGMAEAIQQALAMPVDEQVRRNRPMRDRLRRYDVHRWSADFLGRLHQAEAYQRERPHRRLTGEWRTKLERAFAAASRRLLLLDYDGTLVPFASLPHLAAPDAEARRLLTDLSADPANTVVIISGRDHVTLEQWLGGLGAALVAEHGAWRLTDPAAGWRLDAAAADTNWKEPIRPLLEAFVDRTPGALIEEKALALAWHYRLADPELGALRAKELADTLASLIANTSLQVQRGNRVLEVKQSQVGKGQAAAAWLAADPPPELILVAGDDDTDEDMFAALPPSAWSIRVGQPLRTRARFTVGSAHELRELLAGFVRRT